MHHSVNNNTENLIHFAKQQQQKSFRKKWSRFATGALFLFMYLDKTIKFSFHFPNV